MSENPTEVYPAVKLESAKVSYAWEDRWLIFGLRLSFLVFVICAEVVFTFALVRWLLG